jgi:hypothetical protein
MHTYLSLQYISGGTWLKHCYSNKTFMMVELLVCAFSLATRTTLAIPRVEMTIEISVKPKIQILI